MSPRTLRITMIVLTVLGVVLASYLTYIHYAGIKPLCGTNGGGCEIVQTSEYSKLVGVPVALIGLLGYIAILGSLLVPESETSRLATVAFTVVGFGFSAYLTYRELFSIHHICEYCVSSAGLITIIMCLSVWRFLRGDPRLREAAAKAELTHGETAAPLGT
ncbi:MAG TPA: vitamin K epoxide reductase family protein [Solirubrobacteraceae bacterium]|nr:vitamin K epoxide reductase family protein [Solirubrobacteraceae bacterium]